MKVTVKDVEHIAGLSRLNDSGKRNGKIYRTV